MKERTAKAIKDFVEVLDNHFIADGDSVRPAYGSGPMLERVLHELAEAIIQDAIEP